MHEIHKNSPKRFIDDITYFITCKTNENYPFFKNEILCRLWIEELKLAKQLKKFRLYGFCLNYDHFHLMIQPENKIANIPQIMQFLKRHFSRNVNHLLGFNAKSNSSINYNKFVGDIGQCRLQIQHFQDYVDQIKIQFFSNNKLFDQKFSWQKSFYDHAIRTESDFQKHINYTSYNFLKHNLPENWKFSSLNYAEIIDEI